MEMLETSAKLGENVLAAFEKLIGIVHDWELAVSKNLGGIKGMHVYGVDHYVHDTRSNPLNWMIRQQMIIRLPHVAVKKV
jgi:hypothetical protein